MVWRVYRRRESRERKFSSSSATERRIVVSDVNGFKNGQTLVINHSSLRKSWRRDGQNEFSPLVPPSFLSCLRALLTTEAANIVFLMKKFVLPFKINRSIEISLQKHGSLHLNAEDDEDEHENERKGRRESTLVTNFMINWIKPHYQHLYLNK